MIFLVMICLSTGPKAGLSDARRTLRRPFLLEGMGSWAAAEVFGGKLQLDAYVGASAAIGIAQRKGLGRIRH